MAGCALIACWIIFYGYWIAAAAGVKATAERQSVVANSAHRLPVIAAALLLFGQWRQFGLGHPLLPQTRTIAWTGVGITALGLALAVWARRTLGSNWSSSPTLKQGHELVQRGPYAFVRNPIYTALLLMLLGTCLFVGRARAAIALPLAIAGLWIKLKQEEALMLRQFPESYPAYRRRVKALVPFIL